MIPIMHGDGGGRPPYGWVATGGGAEAFAPVPAEIAVLTQIRDRRKAGWMIQDIADELNSAGTPSKAGRPWNRHTVNRALYAIQRFGIPADIDAATKAAHQKVAQKKAGGYRIRKPSGRPQQTARRTGATRVT